jgi:inhibitor of cysteine peptidase
MQGDCDGDGDIDVLDALIALKMAVGKVEVNLVADMNGDGQVTSLDAAEIMRTALKEATPGGVKNINVDASYSGKQVEISVGESLVVTLASNATTGYSWSVIGISDDSVLQKSGNQYTAPQTTLLGAGGQEVWTFKALKKGTTTMSMGYSRPWGIGTLPIETFSLTVVVN